MSAHANYLWWNGRIVPWHEANVHVTTLGWSTIGGVFEGIKAYWNSEQQELYGLHFAEHFDRFITSMRLQRMEPRWSAETLIDSTVELLRANEARYDVYVRPLAYFGDTTWFGTSSGSPGDVFIWTTPFESVLGTSRTYTAGVASWTRLSDNMMAPRIKCLSNYQNGRMALIEAKRHGYDSPILLNDQQKVTEGPASCLFIVRDGVAITPSLTSGILESVTRRAVLQMCREDLGIPTEEREVDRTELYVASEMFFCGTGAEIQPVVQVDGYEVGSGGIGPITRRIEAAYHDMVRGRSPHARWRTPIIRSGTPIAAYP